MGQCRHFVPDDETSAALLLRQAASTAAARGPWTAGRYASWRPSRSTQQGAPVDGDVEARALPRRGPAWGASSAA
eukprot:3737707-Lingulodinium_polyedra.AAC.1